MEFYLNESTLMHVEAASKDDDGKVLLRCVVGMTFKEFQDMIKNMPVADRAPIQEATHGTE